jgi:hypothetical protein
MHNQEFPITVSINISDDIHDLSPSLDRLSHEVFNAALQVLPTDSHPTVTLNSVFVDYEQDDVAVTVDYVIDYLTTNFFATEEAHQIINEIKVIESVLSVFRKG